MWVLVVPLPYVPYLRETPGEGKKGSYSFWGVFHIRGQDNFHQYSQYISLHPLDFQLSNPSGALGISAIVKAVEHLPARFVPFTGRRMWQIHLLRDRPMVMAQDRATLVNIKIAGKCIFIHQKNSTNMYVSSRNGTWYNSC